MDMGLTITGASYRVDLAVGSISFLVFLRSFALVAAKGIATVPGGMSHGGRGEVSEQVEVVSDVS